MTGKLKWECNIQVHNNMYDMTKISPLTSFSMEICSKMVRSSGLSCMYKTKCTKYTRHSGALSVRVG